MAEGYEWYHNQKWYFSLLFDSYAWFTFINFKYDPTIWKKKSFWVYDWKKNININTTKVLWLSSFFSNYYFISFGGCFRIFGGSISTSIHWFSCQSVQSADNVNKEKLVWLFILFFMPTFFRCNTPSCAIPKEKHNILNYSFWDSTLV